jgi:hypothetical protein
MGTACADKAFAIELMLRQVDYTLYEAPYAAY